MIPQVVASERGKAQTVIVTAIAGLKDLRCTLNKHSGTRLESRTQGGDSPVCEMLFNVSGDPE